jgi:hypothetical protein
VEQHDHDVHGGDLSRIGGPAFSGRSLAAIGPGKLDRHGETRQRHAAHRIRCAQEDLTMADEELPPPIEIPWRLAATTQPRVEGDPAETTISLFFHEPDDEVLSGLFPDERLVYLKATVSVSPARFPEDARGIAATYLGEGVPCFHLLLDLEVRDEADSVNTIRPYFHAAAPLHRRMLQTGVVGAEAFEGEADGQSMGRSGSQMYESLTSSSRTTSAGGGASFGIGPFSVGGSVRTTSTDIASDRSVSQVVDTTSRQASQERRELVSHMTRVENVLTLLSAKYPGTPYLRFSLAPQPLQVLAIDPSDPNLWFNQLLHRRSSGIEGVQEFTAVVLVPRGQGFCVNARLRRVCLLDSPPGPFTLEERFDEDLDLLQLFRIVNYLYRLYPKGTPVEELDVDIAGLLTPATDFIRPVIELWGLDLMDQLVEAHVLSPTSASGNVARTRANYKTLLELWLDTLYDEYETELAKSPLERGVLLGENRILDTCFTVSGDDELEVGESSSSTTPLVPVDIDLGRFDVGAIDLATARAARGRGGAGVRTQAVSTITRWASLERQVVGLLDSRTDLPHRPMRLDDPGIMRVLLDRWSKLAPDDSRNLGFDEAADMLRLSGAERRRLKAAGVTDLRGIARALMAAPVYERQNRGVAALSNALKGRRGKEAPIQPVEFALSGRVSDEVRRAIGAGLAAASEPDDTKA